MPKKSIPSKKLALIGIFALGISFGAFWLASSLQLGTSPPLASDKNEEPFLWNTNKAKEDLAEFAALPHPFGSARQLELSEYVRSRLQENKIIDVVFQDFQSETPHPSPPNSLMAQQTIEKKGRNILAWIPGNTDCLVILGSHYDSKHLGEKISVGANDSGSSSAALIQLTHLFASAKHKMPSSCSILSVWFDGEEAQLLGWDDWRRHPSKIHDNTYGSRYLVNTFKKCTAGKDTSIWHSNRCIPYKSKEIPIRAFILLDMIGGKPLSISNEANSTKWLQRLLRETLKSKGMENVLNAYPIPIEDDHIPFLSAGIPALNIINFDDLEHWHKTSDTIDNISFENIEKISAIAFTLAWKISNPTFNPHISLDK